MLLRLYETLGAHADICDGASTRFVWAQTPVRSRLGNYWDGRRHPMRSRKESGNLGTVYPQVITVVDKYEMIDATAIPAQSTLRLSSRLKPRSIAVSPVLPAD